MTEEHNGWNEWAKKVLADIERLDNNHKFIMSQMDTNNKNLMEQINLLRVDLAILKTKSAVIGGAWGTIMGIVVGLVYKFMEHVSR